MNVVRLFLWCAVFLFLTRTLEAVHVRVETTSGDSVSFAPVGDTLSVRVHVDTQGEVVTGVELFLRYDPRVLTAVDTLRESLLFGRVLIDTQRVVSDSARVVHFAEADLAGKSVTGVLYEMDFLVVGDLTGKSVRIWHVPPSYPSVYTTRSATGETFPVEFLHDLVFNDLPPQLQLPTLVAMKEDQTLTIDLSTWVLDDTPTDGLLWSVRTLGDNVVAQVAEQSQLVLSPAKDFSGQVRIEMTVTDISGGQTQGEVVLNVASINDVPVWVPGVLPDSLEMVQRAMPISLAGAAIDPEGDDLVWQAVGTREVQVEVVNNIELRVVASSDWVGETSITVSVGDGIGEPVEQIIRIVRHVALSSLLGDFDENGEVDFADFLAFAQAFGDDNPSVAADFNADGQVDFADFLVFAQNFGRTS